MYRREPRHQLLFEDFFLPFGGRLSGNNRWIKLHALIPWDELEDDYASQFCRGFGAPAKPFQMALGALIIKARLGLADEELVEQIRENPYLQFFIIVSTAESRSGWCTRICAVLRLGCAFGCTGSVRRVSSGSRSACWPSSSRLSQTTPSTNACSCCGRRARQLHRRVSGLRASARPSRCSSGSPLSKHQPRARAPLWHPPYVFGGCLSSSSNNARASLSWSRLREVSARMKRH